MPSIQSRLAIGLTLALIVLLLLQWFVVSISIRYLTENYIATHLLQDSETLLASISLPDTKAASLIHSKLGLVYSQPFSGQYYKVSFGSSEFRSRSLWDTDLTHAKITDGFKTQVIVNGPLQQSLLQVTSIYTKKSKLIYISVAEDLTPIYKDITTFQLRFSSVTLLIVLILIAVQAYIINKNLKPLDIIRRELQSLDEGQINSLSENVPSEVLPLVRELNQQLKVFRQRLERSRHSTGNLAHTLKNPLSLLYQLANNAIIKNNSDIKETLEQATRTIEENINRELKRARIAGVQLSARHSKLEPEIISLIETLTTIYQHKDIELFYTIPKDMLCYMDRQDLLEMLGNVLDNACKWANHQVRLTINKTDNIVFKIEDDGPGCSDDKKNKLTERGIRFDEQKTGSGLGLSIVKSIVDDYNGELQIITSENLHGLQVEIQIPISCQH